jgi:ribosome recycling factor
MQPGNAVHDAKNKFQKAIERFHEEVKKLRTGRAHPGMLDSVVVEAYGTQMPIIQTATITVPEPQLIQVSPFDPTNLQAIATAIRNDQSLGMNPTDDGRVIRVPIPPLTEERRREIAKQMNEKVEEAMIAMRNARHDAMRDIKASKEKKEIGEDEANRLEKQVDEAMNACKLDVEHAAKAKEQEILTL